MTMDWEILGKAIIIVGGLAMIMALILAFADTKLKIAGDVNAVAIEKLLPGINCGACGHPGCIGLANAIVEGNGSENDCTPSNAKQREDIKKYRKTNKL